MEMNQIGSYLLRKASRWADVIGGGVLTENCDAIISYRSYGFNPISPPANTWYIELSYYYETYSYTLQWPSEQHDPALVVEKRDSPNAKLSRKRLA